jgi:hypothetical protein
MVVEDLVVELVTTVVVVQHTLTQLVVDLHTSDQLDYYLSAMKLNT